MFNWNLKNFDLKDVDFSKLDLTKLDLTKLDLTRLDVRKMDLPKFEMPNVDLPKLEMPNVELPADMERVAGFARDAAYAGVGVAVVTMQKLDEQRRELTGQVTAQVRKLVGTVA